MAKAHIPRICRYEPCSKEFISSNAKQVFCCPTCAQNQWLENKKANKVPKLPKKCVTCGDSFIPRNKNQFTCGKEECRDKYYKERKKGSYEYKHKRDPMEEPKPPKPKKIKPGTKAWKEASAYRRMDCMNLTQSLVACKESGITYKEAQTMYYNKQLPDDFGRTLR